jgi:hypothetical protein
MPDAPNEKGVLYHGAKVQEKAEYKVGCQQPPLAANSELAMVASWRWGSILDTLRFRDVWSHVPLGQRVVDERHLQAFGRFHGQPVQLARKVSLRIS